MAEYRYDSRQLKPRIRSWSKDSITLPTGVLVPAEITADLEHPEWPCPVRIYVTVTADSGPTISGVQAIGETAVSYGRAAEIVRRTGPLDPILRELVTGAVAQRVMIALEGESAIRGGVIDSRILEAAAGAWDAAQPRRRRTLTRDLLRQVAGIYRSAHSAGEPPTVAVAERFQISHRTATRWVAEARRVGELGPAPGTKPGEIKS